MKFHLFACSIIMTLLAGCADDFEADHSVEPKVTVEYRIDGVPAESYFAQFALKSFNNCSSPKSYQAMASSPVRIAVNRYNEDVHAQLTLLLGVDRNYALLYQETQVILAGWVRQTVTRTQTVRGSWSVVEDRLVLSGFGEGTGGRNDGRATVQLQANRDVLSVGLEGRRMLLVPVAIAAVFVPEMDPCRPGKP